MARYLKSVINAARLLPHLCVFLMMKNDRYIAADIERWEKIKLKKSGNTSPTQSFLRLMVRFPEFRNIFYHRAGNKGKYFAFLCPPMNTLYLSTKKIGPGLFVQHGFSTIIAAKEIGANCWINQQVTVGFSNTTDKPTIEDNVTIFAGAKVIGNVTIGRNSKIGANAVVVKDVPPNCTVVGVPGVIVKKNGRKISEYL